MGSKPNSFLELLKQGVLSKEQARLIHEELSGPQVHNLPVDRRRHPDNGEQSEFDPPHMYECHDLAVLQKIIRPEFNYIVSIRSLDELLERDKLREKDGFPRKIRVGRLVKPGKGGKDKIVVVPTTVEEKLIHDKAVKPAEDQTGGQGEGQEGEVIGESPVHEEPGAGGAGSGEGGPHEIESNAFDLGRILTEKFELPNLKEKGKKRSLTHYTYDMTDRNRGFGQLLDKKATLRQILETNITLGNVPDVTDVDLTNFLIAPSDLVYRVLSREIDYQSQAMVFFLRDYSGSMSGKPTELVVSQHLLIYSWLYFQYARHVESRFILHDVEAKEVPDFYTYYNTRVAGGTKVASAYHLVNEIVDHENLIQDYNIYVFHGTDGDDWDTGGKEAIPELTKILTYANRIGITIAQRIGAGEKTEVEKYVSGSKLLDTRKDLLRLDVLPENADEKRLIDGIKKLIS
ncbi:MAG: DUF444 family protein [Deltaproteobacteria bacterium]|nr:DUF444 family protein [Deltaproteobacteria bacterium]